MKQDELSQKAWAIDGVNHSQRIDITKKGQPKRVQEIPTIVKHSENDPKTTAEHVILTDTKELSSVVRLSATRMAKYAAIAIINCNLQVEKESDLKPTFDSLYPFILDYSTSRKFKDLN